MLTEQCLQALSTIKTLVLAQQNQHQRLTLLERTTEWKKVRADWRRTVEQASWLELRTDSVPDCQKIQLGLRRDAREAADRLDAKQDVAALAADPLWTRLLQSTDKATNALRQATEVAWRSWIDATEAPIAPAALKAKVPGIPSNREILQRYGTVYADYERLVKQSAPRSAGDAAALRAIEVECKAAVNGLNYDVPPGVEAFFRAVDGHSATLENLTPEVLQWLGENSRLKHFMIRNSPA